MSTFDKLIREAVQAEVTRAVAPLAAAIARLQSQGDIASRIAAAVGGVARRGPGRPPKAAATKKATAGRRRGKPGRPPSEKRGCAVQKCKKSARSKGYCSAHYQKMRLLARTGRLPSDWVDNAPPGSVSNVVLPRGRAGAKALADHRKQG